ncbi:mastermind-like protein 3 [Trichomycterus rosablanca]|uniref:mastermind-like protein 3 n=1 Tax=Trichomycterus rosablanca TaxID=2290929 RepID=UPI002F35CD92
MMMGDFSGPAAACINSGANVNLSAGSNASTPNNNCQTGVPKHSTVVERLRQRIEGCRRHHDACEARYQQAHAEQMELDRRETAALYQRTLEQKAKKGKQSKQQEPGGDTAEQRNSTLIALQETVKRKLDSAGARSPLNGDQNGICDGSYSPTTKRLRKEGNGGLDSLGTLPNNVPPISPLHQMDIKPTLPTGNNASNNTVGNGTAGTNHITGRTEDLVKNGGMPGIKMNGSLDLDDGFSLLKDLKQEPLDDAAGIESSDTSLSNQNKLFSDINLNDQEWQELIDELANTVPEDDMHDLFNEDFEDKKEIGDFGRPMTEPTQNLQDPAPPQVATAPNNPPQSQGGQLGSPQVRPASSGPPFATAANGTPPQQPLQQSPAVAVASGSPASCVARSPQTPTQAQTQTSRPGNGFMMNQSAGVGPPGSTAVPPGGPGPGGPGGGGGPVSVPPTTELSPAEQLKQMAAQQQQRAKLIQQKHQQQSQTASWSPAGAPTSPYGGPFNPDKPNSPMMYPQSFNTPNSMVPKPGMNNYLPQNPINIMSQQQAQQQQPATMATQNPLNKQLSYSNTKPLSHFSAVEHMSQRMTPPMANQAKNTMMPYMQGTGGQGGGPPPAQGPMPGQTAHLTEEQKRMMIMKQKVLGQGLPYGSMQQHPQEQAMVGMPRQAGSVQPPHGGGGGVTSGGPNGAGPGSYLANQQQQQQHQAAMMKQMMAMEQEKRVQLHLMEQQKAQLLREQRQQQQHHLLAEQLQQQQPHIPRQMNQTQRNPYPLQQFQGTQQEMAARNQALQNMRNARLLQQQQQNQGMLQMAPVQNPNSMPAQSDMGMAYVSQTGTQAAMYQGMNSGMSQMLQSQHHPNQAGMAMAQRPAGGGGGYGPGMLMNPALSQQQMKPSGPPMPKAQTQRLQSMMGGGGGSGGQAWPQQQNMQTMSGRTTNDMVAFNSSPAYAMQGGQPPRMPKQHFTQGVVDPRAINPAGMSGAMMSHMAGQSGHGRTGQPRVMVLPGVGQPVPSMAAFGQGSAQAMTGPGGGAYMTGGQPQGYQRTSGQDLAYGYAGQSGGTVGGGGVSFGLSDSTELDSTDGWMEEFFPSQ